MEIVFPLVGFGFVVAIFAILAVLALVVFDTVFFFDYTFVIKFLVY